jgi:phosphoenolpyruvate-protein phosphotransferase (PTS system enzyme I)
MEIRRGIAVSEGVAIGPALVLDTEGVRIETRTVPPDLVEGEVVRLRAAFAQAAGDARRRQQSLAATVGDDIADIFDAHGGLYEDPKLQADVEGLIRANRYSAEYAVSRHVRGIVKRLDAAGAAVQLTRLRSDFRDVEKQLLVALVGGLGDPLTAVSEPVIVVAHDLTPSETAQFDPRYVHAMATESGGATSHTAILAGALEIPAVVGVGQFLTDVSGGDTVIVDGTQGLLIIDPDPPTLRKYELLRRAQLSPSGEHRLPVRNVPAITRDGERVYLHGNIEFPSEARPCLDRGADGVGLYRTEFLYVNKAHDPTEEEQYEAYKAVLTELGPDHPVVIRTLDLGGDKFVPATGVAVAEKNPFLGLRSVRLCLRNLPLFKTQLRAILRAGVHGDARVMFPMVSTVMELRQCRSVLREVQEDLEEAGIPYKADLPVGTMIEVPSAALMADVLARQVNFFSIGTNDLVQYTLAADRNNETVADLYNAADPAVLRLIATVVRAAAGKAEVTVCGEMSGEPMFVALLLGLGIRSLSATPRKIPELKRVVRALTVPDAERLAAEALRLETAREVNALLSAHLKRTLPDAEV